MVDLLPTCLNIGKQLNKKLTILSVNDYNNENETR